MAMAQLEFTVEELNFLLRLVTAWPANEKATALTIRQKLDLRGQEINARRQLEQRAVAAAVEETDKKPGKARAKKGDAK